MLLDDDGKLRMKINNKRFNAKKLEIEFNLTKREVKKLLREAGITSSNWCHKGFHLARYNDIGNYDFDNCRFIPCHENYGERKITDRMKLAGSRNMIRENSSPHHGSRIARGLANSMSYRTFKLKRKLQARRKYFEKQKQMNQSYVGNRNSQYGSFWVTDGVKNIKLRKGQEIPFGYCRGRKMLNR